MGKTGASSWLSVVKKALSPTKGSGTRGEQQKDDYKKKGKRKWIFRKPTPYERTIEHKEAKNIASSCNANITRRKNINQWKLGLRLPMFGEMSVPDHRQAMAVALATTATAEAAVATAQAAVEVMRLASPSIIIAEKYAAVAIQTSFRGYLARRAFKALKGVVKLQAFVRGYNVRKRAKLTLQCMQSLLRVQNQVCDQRKRLSTDSKFSPSKHLYQIAEMKCNSIVTTSSVTEDEEHGYKPREPILKREDSLAYAFSRRIRRSELETRQQEEKSSPRYRIKTGGTDTLVPYSPRNRQPRYFPSSPIHTKSQNLLINSLASPHRSRIRRDIEEKMTYTPDSGAPVNASPAPSYMAATESATARLRSKSAPRQRPPLERERESGLRSAKKRLSFAVKDSYSGI